MRLIEVDHDTREALHIVELLLALLVKAQACSLTSAMLVVEHISQTRFGEPEDGAVIAEYIRYLKQNQEPIA